MKLVIDLTIVTKIDKITGIERVAIETLKSVLKDGSEFFEIYILCSKTASEYIKGIVNSLDFDKKEIYIYNSPVKNRIFTDQIWLPYIIKKIAPKYVYYTTLGIPLIQMFPFSVIIHDVVAWVMPETISKGMKYYYKPLIKFSIKNKKLKNIITVSEFSRKSVMKELKVKEEKITVNYLGIADNFIKTKKDINKKEILKKYNIKSKYLILLGTLEPRKNIQGAIEAFSLLKEKYNYEGNLVVVGRVGWMKNLNIKPTISSSIIFTGFVDDEDLPIILSESTAFIFPSFYEGFGLPLIEAMSLGIPVICSNIDSLTEVGGNACVYFDPYSIEDMAETIYSTVNNHKKMEEISLLCKSRAKIFSWEKHGRIVIDNILKGVENGK